MELEETLVKATGIIRKIDDLGRVRNTEGNSVVLCVSVKETR